MAYLPKGWLDQISVAKLGPAADDLVDELGDIIGGSRIESSDGRFDFEQIELPEFAPSSPLPEFDWNQGQRAAIDRIAAWRADPTAPRILALTGPAGTGKTTVLQAVRKRLRGTRTAWAAMTGKAAARMKAASGVKGRTLHSVLFQPPREVDNVIEQKIDLEFEQLRVSEGSCLLAIDEASMIGSRLKDDLERSSYDKILLIGDHIQIPPVLSKQEEEERGDDYSVFADVECAHLTEVMRAAGAVLAAATRVREQQLVPEDSDARAVDDSYTYLRAGSREVAIDLACAYWLADRDDHAIITWRNDSRMRANRIIRSKLGFVGDIPLPGEPLIVRRNLYRTVRGVNLMNGDLVTLESWDGPGPTICSYETCWATVRAPDGVLVELLTFAKLFDGKMPYVGLHEWKRAVEKAGAEPIPLSYGYCLTGHQAQGSEWRRVTTVLPGDFSNPHFKKLTRLATGEKMLFAMRFLYTAIARARKVAMLIVAS